MLNQSLADISVIVEVAMVRPTSHPGLVSDDDAGCSLVHAQLPDADRGTRPSQSDAKSTRQAATSEAPLEALSPRPPRGGAPGPRHDSDHDRCHRRYHCSRW